jgi:hypothetical protein
MNVYEQKKIELELKKFTSLNFGRPSECNNLEQIRFYAHELSFKIEGLETKFGYTPPWICGCLGQSNAKQNKMLQIEFRNVYQ